MLMDAMNFEQECSSMHGEGTEKPASLQELQVAISSRHRLGWDGLEETEAGSQMVEDHE